MHIRREKILEGATYRYKVFEIFFFFLILQGNKSWAGKLIVDFKVFT